MRDSDIVLYNLSKKASEDNYKFQRLYKNLYNKDFYLKAIGNTYANAGAGTKGSDNKTIDGFGQEAIEELIELLKNEKYQPTPVRRVYIDKKNSNKKRPIGIPTYKDKVVQEIVRLILDAIYEPKFSKYSHGFRNNKSCHTALSQIKNNFTGINWFIEGDIKGCFDNISHEVLTNILRKRIEDEKLIRLIYKFLKCGYIENWKYNKTYSGTPQGGIISPLLANIYLNELDIFMENLKSEFNTGDKAKGRTINQEWRNLDNRMKVLKRSIEKEFSKDKLKELKKIRLERAKSHYWASMNKSYKRIQYVRYADDFIVGVIGSKEDATQIKNKINDFLKNELKMELSLDKTLITHCYERAKFLGYEITKRNSSTLIKDKNGVLKSSYNGTIEIYMPTDRVIKWLSDENIIKNINSKDWRMKHRPYLLNLTDLEIVSIYNSEIRGLYNYYKMAKNVHTHISTLTYAMEYSCLATLANKHKSTISKMKDKYKVGKGWGIKYQNSKGETKIRYFFNESIKRCRVPIGSSDIDNKYNLMKIAGSRTQLEQRIKASKCELCGISDKNTKYEIHHINKIKNLKGKSQWELLMIARNRKTLVLCKECHLKIHNN